MSILSAVGSPLATPTGTTNTQNQPNEGEAAQTNETTTGTTEADETDTDTATTSDDSGTNDGTTQSFATAKDLSVTPAEPKAESIVAAQIETPAKLTADQAEAAARQNAEDAQKAYKLQSILDGRESLSLEAEKIAPAADTPEIVQSTTSTVPDEVPV